MGRGNRHGFQNFGGRRTGQNLPVNNADVEHLKWIHHYLTKEGPLSTKLFDELRGSGLGDVIRHTLRRAGYITEVIIFEEMPKMIQLTSKAQLLLRGLPKFDNNLPS